MKNIVLAFLLCFAVLMFASPPKAKPAPPNEDCISRNYEQAVVTDNQNARVEIQKTDVVATDLKTDICAEKRMFRERQSGYVALISNSNFSQKPDKIPYCIAVGKHLQKNKILPSYPHYFWGDSKVIS